MTYAQTAPVIGANHARYHLTEQLQNYGHILGQVTSYRQLEIVNKDGAAETYTAGDRCWVLIDGIETYGVIAGLYTIDTDVPDLLPLGDGPYVAVDLGTEELEKHLHASAIIGRA